MKPVASPPRAPRQQSSIRVAEPPTASAGQPRRSDPTDDPRAQAPPLQQVFNPPRPSSAAARAAANRVAPAITSLANERPRTALKAAVELKSGLQPKLTAVVAPPAKLRVLPAAAFAAKPAGTLVAKLAAAPAPAKPKTMPAVSVKSAVVAKPLGTPPSVPPREKSEFATGLSESLVGSSDRPAAAARPARPKPPVRQRTVVPPPLPEPAKLPQFDTRHYGPSIAPVTFSPVGDSELPPGFSTAESRRRRLRFGFGVLLMAVLCAAFGSSVYRSGLFASARHESAAATSAAADLGGAVRPLPTPSAAQAKPLAKPLEIGEVLIGGKAKPKLRRNRGGRALPYAGARKFTPRGQ